MIFLAKDDHGNSKVSLFHMWIYQGRSGAECEPQCVSWSPQFGKEGQECLRVFTALQPRPRLKSSEDGLRVGGSLTHGDCSSSPSLVERAVSHAASPLFVRVTTQPSLLVLEKHNWPFSWVLNFWAGNEGFARYWGVWERLVRISHLTFPKNNYWGIRYFLFLFPGTRCVLSREFVRKGNVWQILNVEHPRKCPAWLRCMAYREQGPGCSGRWVRPASS